MPDIQYISGSVQIFVTVEGLWHNGMDTITLDMDLMRQDAMNVKIMLVNKIMVFDPELASRIKCESCYRLQFCGIDLVMYSVLDEQGVKKWSMLHAARRFQSKRCKVHGKPYMLRPCHKDFAATLTLYRDLEMVRLVKERKETNSCIVDDYQWLQTMANGAPSYFVPDDRQGAHFFVPNAQCYCPQQETDHEHLPPQ